MSTTTGLLSRIHALWLAQDAKDIDQRRIQRMRLICCLTLILLGSGWSVFFAFRGMWLVSALCAVLLPCAWSVFALAQRNRASTAHLLLFSVSIAIVVCFSLFLDAPTVDSQRSIHLFLLPLSVAAFLTFRQNHALLSYGMAGLCLLFFFALTGSSWTPFPEHNLPENIRIFGKWINGLVAGGSLFVVLHIMHTDASQHTDMDRELHLALQEQQFVLYFQPQLDQQQRVIGAEVLVRWNHPQRGILPPGIFIDHAERNGLMVPLGQWILEQACQQIQQWRKDPFLRDIELAINVSQLQFRQSDFAANVLGAVNRSGIPPQLLELELTETMMVLDMDDLETKIKLLQAQGLRFSLDDFGTGFSSLSHLRQLPLHTLKIDRSFVKDLPHDTNSKTIVRSLLSLAQSMHLTVVAEGIETPDQHAFLVQHGCPKFQGFLFSQPLPLEAFEAFVRQHNAPLPPNETAAEQPLQTEEALTPLS